MTKSLQILFIGTTDGVRDYIMTLAKRYETIGQLCASNAILNVQLKSKIQAQQIKGGDC